MEAAISGEADGPWARLTQAGQVWEVLAVRYGTRETRRSEVYLNYPLYGCDDAPIGMDYFFWIIRNPTRTVVVDTGFSETGGAVRGRTMLTSPPTAFRALGVDPAAAPTVVVTHAHYDHIGNLRFFDRSPVVVARAEVEFWQGPFATRTQFRHSVEDDELGALARVVEDGRAVLFEDAHQVADGIEVLRIGGHTPGQSVVAVRTADGPVLLASDAVHYYEELDDEMPFVSVANLVDMYAGFDTIKGWVADGRIRHVVSGHDPDTLRRFPPVPGLPCEAAVIGAAA